jgi:protein gp37
MMGERVVIDGEDEKPWRAARERIGMAHRFNSSLCLDPQVPFVHNHWRGGRTPKAGGRVFDRVLWNEMPRATMA